MSKREKKVEVSVKDIERDGQPVQQVVIRGRLIGEVITNGQRFKAIMLNDGSEFGVRSQEEGLEVVLQQFHLHQY